MSAVDSSWWRALGGKVSSETLLERDESLASKTTFRVGGAAAFYAEPASIEDLREIWSSAQKAGVNVFFLGRGSNLIVADSGFSGLVIRLAHPFWRSVSVEQGRVIAMAGARLKQVCGEAARAGLAGLEFLEGIPGSVGGSLRMNAGAMGGWIFDVVESVDLMTPDGLVKNVPRDAFHVGYRQCAELLGAVALGATFAPVDSITDQAAIRTRLETYAATRKASQPREPSAGCIFKNPKNGHAGKLIDEVGLKGRGIGGVEVSTVHGNFMINRDKGSAADTLALIREVRREVQAATGVELEPEVLLLGARWEDVLA